MLDVRRLREDDKFVRIGILIQQLSGVIGLIVATGGALLWPLHPGDSDYSTRWRMIKSHFTHHCQGKGTIGITTSRQEKGEADIWQRRFWEYLIRNQVDLTRHIEYIHYNPVKHGLARTPAEWQYSSYKKYVQDGIYRLDWGDDGKVWTGKRWME